MNAFYVPEITIGERPFADLYPQWQQLMEITHAAIEDEIASGKTPRAYMADESRFLQFFTELMQAHPALKITENTIPDVLPHVFDEFFGLGLLREHLENPEVEDILMDSSDGMDVVIGGVKHRLPTPFVDDQDAIRWMQRMLKLRGLTISPKNPIENSQMSDGSRIICLIPPVSKRPMFAMRKHRIERFQAETYVRSGVAPPEFFYDLQAWTLQKQNLIISGATGSGKTTLINYAAGLIPIEERILVVEDTPELQIPHARVASLASTSRGARVGEVSSGAISIRHLVGHTLRMRPDRIIVGESRGPEAFDLLQAMNTGHSGGMSTLHANSPAEAILRLESLAAPAEPNMPLWALQDLIAMTVGIVVQLVQVPQSSARRVVEAAQVLHPMQATPETLALPGTRQLRENLYLRPLWRWDPAQQLLVKVADFTPPEGTYDVRR